MRQDTYASAFVIAKLRDVVGYRVREAGLCNRLRDAEAEIRSVICPYGSDLLTRIREGLGWRGGHYVVGRRVFGLARKDAHWKRWWWYSYYGGLGVISSLGRGEGRGDDGWGKRMGI